VLTVPIAPLADYVNHLGRMEILATLDSNPLLRRFYDVQWQLIPNLAMDALVPPLGRLIGVELAGRLFLIATLGLTAGGVFALNRALTGRFGLAPLAVFPFLYNGIFLYGFANYLFAMAMALWATAAWVRLREERPMRRLAGSTIMVLVLFLAHLFGLGLYGLAVGAIELANLPRTWRNRTLLRDAAVVALPFLLVLSLLSLSPTMSLADQFAWSINTKAEGLDLTVSTYYGWLERPAAWMLLGGAVVLLAMGRIRLAREAWLFLAVGAVVFLAMPHVLFGSDFADERLPIALICLVLGGLRIDSATPRMQAVLVSLAVLLTIGRVVGVEMEWRDLSRSYDEMRQALKLVEPGSTILVAEASHPHGEPMRNVALSHAPCLALLDRSSFVSTAFTVQGKQVLTVRPAYNGLADRLDGDPPTLDDLAKAAAQPADAQGPFWTGWTQHFDYVFVLYTKGDPNPLPAYMKLVHSGNGFQIYRVEPEDGDDDAEQTAAGSL
jgi:hypothetical protein